MPLVAPKTHRLGIHGRFRRPGAFENSCYPLGVFFKPITWWTVARPCPSTRVEPPAPFIHSHLAFDQWRLAWPHGGFRGSTKNLSYWGGRYAVTVRGAAVTVIDASRRFVAKLSIRGFRLRLGNARLALDELWFPLEDGRHLVVPHATLAGLFDRSAGRVDIDLDSVPTEATLGFRWPRDPALDIAAAVPTSRRADLEQLLDVIADHPDDEATRMVVIDLLIELGLPCGTAFARLRAGERMTGPLYRAAFGPLALFFRNFGLVSGMPVRARLIEHPTLDPAHLALLASDVRLHMITRLDHSEESPISRQIVDALPALRAIEGAWAYIDRLVKRDYRKLTHLYGFYFNYRTLLVHPQLDDVRHLEIVVDMAKIDEMLEQLARDPNLARVPRHLAFVSRDFDPTLATHVLAALPDLPCTGVTIGDITVRKPSVL